MNTMIRNFKFLVIILVAVMSSACATIDGQPRQMFPQSNAGIGSVGQVELGTVQAVRVVQVQLPNRSNTYIATGAGAVVGAAVGSMFGKGKGKTLSTTMGGLLGGAIGNTAANAPQYAAALEIEVRTDVGRTLIVTQAPGEDFFPGQRIRLINNGGRYRVAL